MSKLLWPRICGSFIRRNLSAPSTGPGPNQFGSSGSMSPRYRPTNLQKFILVWTKKFKSKEEIPTYVSPDLIERSRSEARIKLSNILIVLTALASFGAVLAGKAAAGRGESVHQMNLDWHKHYNEEYIKKEEKNK